MTGEVQAPTIRLELISSPQALTLVRGMLAEVGELLGVEQELLDDLKTAISEACNNVVLHAYPDGRGPLEISFYLTGPGLEVHVSDRGRGISEEGNAGVGEEGIGLPVIRALTKEATLSPRPEGGTELRMLFEIERDGKPLLHVPEPAAAQDGFDSRLAGDVVASVSPVSLAGGLMGRLARALAANVQFSLDRFSDIYLVTDALAAHVAASAAASRVAFALSARELRLELSMGPFRVGSGERLSDKGMGGPFPLALLSDELAVERVGEYELVRAVLLDSSGAAE